MKAEKRHLNQKGGEYKAQIQQLKRFVRRMEDSKSEEKQFEGRGKEVESRAKQLEGSTKDFELREKQHDGLIKPFDEAAELGKCSFSFSF